MSIHGVRWSEAFEAFRATRQTIRDFYVTRMHEFIDADQLPSYKTVVYHFHNLGLPVAKHQQTPGVVHQDEVSQDTASSAAVRIVHLTAAECQDTLDSDGDASAQLPAQSDTGRLVVTLPGGTRIEYRPQNPDDVFLQLVLRSEGELC